MELRDRLEAAKAEVERLQSQIKQESCQKVGHNWETYGGMNAGCCESCGCSVPVNVCSKCGDCDYGDSSEAAEIRQQCLES